jgi:hypothetical protein
MKQEMDLKDKKRKQTNEKFNNIIIDYEKIKYHCSSFFLCQKLNSRISSFIQLKPVLDSFLLVLQSLQVPSIHPESPLLAPKSRTYSTVNRIFHYSIRISEGLYL